METRASSTDIQKIRTILTAFSTFLMGFIDAYTFMMHDGIFASAQTGNMVVLGVKLFEGNWNQALDHTFSYAGFLLGAFLGQAVTDYYKHNDWKQYQRSLLYQTIFLFIIALIQPFLTTGYIVLLLGLLAGFELTIFRTIGATTINNGIMTGNSKKMMNLLYKIIFNKNNESKDDFKVLLLGLVLFMMGIGLGTFVNLFYSSANLWASFFMTTSFFSWVLFKYKRTVMKREGENENK